MNSYLNFLSRNKLYTLIEAFGLSMALGFIILLLCYARTEFAVGQKDAINPRTYAVGAGHFVGMTIGTPDAFFANHPEIKRWTRLVNLAEEADMLVGEDYFTAHTVAVDTNFFQLFNYELIGCNRQKVLTSDDEVIVSQSMARRAFGEDNPIGRRLTYEGTQLTVVGVMADFNPSSLFAPIDLIISILQPIRHLRNSFFFIRKSPLAHHSSRLPPLQALQSRPPEATARCSHTSVFRGRKHTGMAPKEGKNEMERHICAKGYHTRYICRKCTQYP